MTETPTIGEERYTSAGNVFRLERMDGAYRYVRRIHPIEEDRSYRWHESQWEEQLPLLGGPTTDYHHFGIFAPRL